MLQVTFIKRLVISMDVTSRFMSAHQVQTGDSTNAEQENIGDTSKTLLIENGAITSLEVKNLDENFFIFYSRFETFVKLIPLNSLFCKTTNFIIRIFLFYQFPKLQNYKVFNFHI